MNKLNCPRLFLLIMVWVVFTNGQTELLDCRVGIDTDWTVRGRCHYSKVNVSSVNDINCTWYRQQNQGSVTLVTEGIVLGQRNTEGSNTFYSGNCSFSVTESPYRTGNHTFYIDFVPGPGRVVTGHIEINEPGKQETNCSERIVFYEGQDGSCDCTNNKTQPGSPPPTVGWRELPPGQPLLLRDIPRRPIETRWSCEMRWGPAGNSIVKTTTITTVIVYGPDNVTISDSPRGSPLTESQDLYEGERVRWRCTGFGASVTLLYRWTGVQCDNGQTSDDCSFTAGRQHDGKTVTCTAINSWFSGVLNANTSIKLNVKYGPDNVTISDSLDGSLLTESQDLYKGERVRWRCTGFGASHTLQYRWTGVQCDNGQTSDDCRFTAGRQHDGKTVTCTAVNFRFPDVLRANASIKLNVTHPPTTPPEITGYINNTELTEGDNVTLTCTVRGGNPPVSSVNFSCGSDHHDNPNDIVVNSALHNDSSVSSTLTILNLQAGDDGTTCVCGAQWPYGPASLNYNLTSSVTLRVNATIMAVTESTSTLRTQQQTNGPAQGTNAGEKINVGAVVGGSVGAVVVIVTVVIVVVFVKRYMGRSIYAKPGPRLEESNYTDLVINEPGGETNRASSHENKAADHDYENSGDKRTPGDDVQYENTGSASQTAELKQYANSEVHAVSGGAHVYQNTGAVSQTCGEGVYEDTSQM